MHNLPATKFADRESLWSTHICVVCTGQPHKRSNTYGPHYFPDTIEADPDRGSCRFVRSKAESYSAEELNAMLLSYVKHRVQEHTGKPVRRCVITVPAFFADGDRRALLAAAEIAGLEVLSLVNDGLAVALKYATDNLQLAKFQGVQRVLFFDMGATATQATVVEFRGREPSSPSSLPAPPSIRVLGAAWDSSLGGTAFTNRLVDMLAKGCAPKADPTKDERAMARLRKEATRAKQVLSANKETVVSIEDLVGDYDLRQTITRSAFEEHCSDLLERVNLPVLAALERAGNLTLKELDSFEVVGGGWRIPSIQDSLVASITRPLGKTLNSDEAACGGAAIMALYLSRAAATAVVAKRRRAHLAAPTQVSVALYIQDIVPHDIFVMIGSELAAVVPGGSPLVLLGGSGHGRGASTEWEEDEEAGFTVMIPVASSTDFVVTLQYTRGATVNPLASYTVTGLEAALQSVAVVEQVDGSSSSHYDIGGSNTVELHMRIKPDGTLQMFRALLVPHQGQRVGMTGEGLHVVGEGDGGESSSPSRVVDLSDLQASLMGGGGGGILAGVTGYGPVELAVSLVEDLTGGGRGWMGSMVGWGRAPSLNQMSEEDVTKSHWALEELEAKEYQVRRRGENCNLLEVCCFFSSLTLSCVHAHALHHFSLLLRVACLRYLSLLVRSFLCSFFCLVSLFPLPALQ